MARRVHIPAYRLHKARNLAVVTIDDHDHYLGAYGSEASRRTYGELIAKHAAGLSLETPDQPPATYLSVSELVLAYMRYAKIHYRKGGKITDEFHCVSSAVAPLLELYGKTDAAALNGPRLKAVQLKMIELGWSRGYINKSICRIRRVVKHAVSDDLVPGDVLVKLRSVAPLMPGRSRAVDLPSRTAIPQENLDAVRDDVSQLVRDLIDLALFTGARPGELCNLTGGMLDRSGEIWTATLADHKMSHLQKTRVLAFGPKSQLILRRYLRANPAARLFGISRRDFSSELKASCVRLKLPPFTGHWLRHTAASAIRAECGLDAAQAALGHSDAKTTQIYAHLDTSQIVDLARKRG